MHSGFNAAAAFCFSVIFESDLCLLVLPCSFTILTEGGLLGGYQILKLVLFEEFLAEHPVLLETGDEVRPRNLPICLLAPKELWLNSAIRLDPNPLVGDLRKFPGLRLRK